TSTGSARAKRAKATTTSGNHHRSALAAKSRSPIGRVAKTAPTTAAVAATTPQPASTRRGAEAPLEVRKRSYIPPSERHDKVPSIVAVLTSTDARPTSAVGKSFS